MLEFLKSNWRFIAIGIIILFFIGTVIYDSVKKKQRKAQVEGQSNVLNSILEGLGSKENIESFIVKGSRVEFVLKDQSLLNKEKLEAVGIKGVVVNSKKITLIVGSTAELIFKDFKVN
jgi:phosphotransferase system IIB component